jgi:2,4-dienoyl-CoA reductase-like NADH-dependent reductase (Old Yellow Enzyme family)
MILASRLSIFDAMDYPYGFGMDAVNPGQPDLTEPAMLLNELRQTGLQLCAVTMGNPYYNPHINRPFDAGPYVPPEPPARGVERLIALAGEIKEKVPGVLFVGAGYSWLRQFAVNAGAYALEHGKADFIGFGRQSFAHPDFARDILLQGRIEKDKTCVTCSKCTELMRNMAPAGCMVRDKTVYTPANGKHIKKDATGGK